MKNYLCINGKKTELTEEQLKELGFITELSPLAKLQSAVRAWNAQEHYKVHDVIEDFGYSFEIIGFNHDKNADDENRPTVTLMAKELLPEHRMNPGKCERGWVDSELRKWLNEEFINTLPSELVELIQPTWKKSLDSCGRFYDTVDKLFIPTESELFGSAIYSLDMCGERYEAFENSKDRQRIGDNDKPDGYWTFSVIAGNSNAFVLVSNIGLVSIGTASLARRAPFCFQIS